MTTREAKDALRDKGYAKAARFLMILGQEQAAEVLRHLNEEEVSGITREIAQVEKVDSDEAAKILEEFGYLLKTTDLVARGGIEMAQAILEKAFDAERARAIVEKIRFRTAPHPFSFLMDLDVEQVKLLLKNESAPVLSVILPHLSPDRAAEMLHSMSPEMQLEVIRRTARLREINPEVLRQAEGTLREKIRTQGEIVTQEVDGQSVLAEILKAMRPSEERAILDRLELQDPELRKAMDKKIVTLDILANISDRDLEVLLRDYSDNELALLCKGLNETQLARVQSNLSRRRWEAVLEENRALGAVFRSEVERAIQEFLDYVKLQQERGEISIIKRGDQVVE
jgi:flagellar motor switch protein FliG